MLYLSPNRVLHETLQILTARGCRCSQSVDAQQPAHGGASRLIEILSACSLSAILNLVTDNEANEALVIAQAHLDMSDCKSVCHTGGAS